MRTQSGMLCRHRRHGGMLRGRWRKTVLQIFKQPSCGGPGWTAAFMDGEDRQDARHDGGILDVEFDQLSICQIWFDDMLRDRCPARAGEQEVEPRSHLDKAPDPRTDHAITGPAGAVG